MTKRAIGYLLCALLIGAITSGSFAPASGNAGMNAIPAPTAMVRVEGPSSTIFQGTITLTGSVDIVADDSGNVYTLDAATPLSALELASRQGGFDLQVTDKWIFFDLFVDSVAGIGPLGFSGWLYRVNAVMPFYGAGFGWQANGPALMTGDEILWYWGMNEPPTRISHSDMAVTGQPFRILVETTAYDYFHIPGNPWPAVNWVPLPGATVNLGGQLVATDASGIATVTVNVPGTYQAFAYAPGYVRTPRMEITVALSAEVRVNPQTIHRASKGQWVTIHVELPAGYDPLLLNRASLLLGGVSVAELSSQYGHVNHPSLSDGDGDGLPEVMIKFDRAALASLPAGEYPLVLTGIYSSGIEVYGESQPVALT